MLRIGIPDQLVDHASPQQSKEALGLTPVQMAERIQSRFKLTGPAFTANSKAVHSVRA
jgi:1-deoxy-D-xylulose-5-phosphate synthase